MGPGFRRECGFGELMSRETYLDWNATAPLRPEAATAMTAALARCGNASSVHRAGRAARQQVERARAAVAALLGAAPDGVAFVSGGTEANHLALLGSDRERILVSAVEHSSVLQAAPDAEQVAVDADGIVDLVRLQQQLAAGPRPAIVSVMLANNETGIIQPVADIARVAQAHGALFHCDAVQAAGKLPLIAAEIGADLISLSAHKLGGPPGIGALVVTGDVELQPMIRGGGQERGRRAGSENLPGIAGFAAAAEAASAALGDYERVRRLLKEPHAHLEQFREELSQRHRLFANILPKLHEAANTKNWREVLEMAEQVLAVAPRHPEARQTRALAWRAVDPTTITRAARPEPLAVSRTEDH